MIQKEGLMMTLHGSKHVANLCNKLMCLTYLALLFLYFLTQRGDCDQIRLCNFASIFCFHSYNKNQRDEIFLNFIW